MNKKEKLSIDYYLSLGTNLGNKENNLKKAINFLKEKIEIVSVSSIYKTEPVDMKPETDFFLNMVIKANTSISPIELLKLTQNIEKKMGREKKSKNEYYEDRIIDIDILLAGNQIIQGTRLTIPHKEMLNRAFVLFPLNEIEPDLTHPISKKKISNFLNSFIKEEILTQFNQTEALL